MPRKSNTQKRDLERFQISFSPQVPTERLFVAEWFSRPWGRRQAWARGMLSLGLNARLAPAAWPVAADEDETLVGTEEKSHSVTITLRRESPDDDLSLVRLDRLPATRRCAWLRETLLRGFGVSCNLSPILSGMRAAESPGLARTSENTLATALASSELMTVTAAEDERGKQSRPISPVQKPSRPKLRENKNRAVPVERNFKEIVQDRPFEPEIQEQGGATVRPDYVLDVDLSAISSDPFDAGDDSETSGDAAKPPRVEADPSGPINPTDGAGPPKRTELLGLFR